LKTFAAQHQRQSGAHRGIVVDNEDFVHRHLGSHPLRKRRKTIRVN